MSDSEYISTSLSTYKLRLRQESIKLSTCRLWKQISPLYDRPKEVEIPFATRHEKKVNVGISTNTTLAKYGTPPFFLGSVYLGRLTDLANVET